MSSDAQYRAEQEAKRSAEYYSRALDAVAIHNDPNYLSKCADTSIAGLGRAVDGEAKDVRHESLRVRLSRRANDASGELTRYSRASEILEQHPEFEAFLELLRLIPLELR